MRSHLLRHIATLIVVIGIAACSVTGSDDAGRVPADVVQPGRPTPTATPLSAAGSPVVESTSTSVAESATLTTAVSPSPAEGYARVLEAPVKPPRPETSGPQKLVLAGSAEGPDTLDPALIRDAESSFYARQIFRGLVRIDNDMLAQPDLAQRIAVSEDGQRYTFTLRDNAVFQDGTAIDAEAVVASLNRAADPDIAGGDGFSLPAAIYLTDIVGAEDRLAGEADTISGIRALDRQTVQIELVAPAESFLFKLAGNAAQIVDVSEATGDDWWTEPNGSGPFILDELSGSQLVLRRFDGFYDGAPLLETVTVLLGSAAAEPLNLYEGGEIDVTEAPFYALDRVLSPSDVLNDELVVVPQLSTGFIMLNPNIEPFDDPLVRQAVVQAFDRAKVARVSLEGKARLAQGMVPPGIMDREWNSEPLAYDLDAARAALERAGESDTRPEFYGYGFGVTLKMILERDLGLESDSISLESAEFTDRLSAQDLAAFGLSWIADYPDPSNFLTSMFHSRSPDNYIGYNNPEVDRLLEAADVEPDADLRAQLYLDAQQLILDDAVLIPLYHDVSYTLIRPYVHGLTISPVGILSFEDVWIEN